ncbi:MAG: PaaI family thioesterase [Actinobacteria bacterium]|nr:MAG: PaaI family thioesterase [Actinomycetota bacterium]
MARCSGGSWSSVATEGRKVNLRRVPPEPPYAVPPERTLDGTLGFEVLEAGSELARGRFPVEDRVKQPFGLVHGGVMAAIAESLCSLATFQAVAGDGMSAQGLSNHTSFVRPIVRGTAHAEARCRHRGRTTWVWEVDVTDDEGRLCAMSRVTMAVRPQSGS